MAKRNRTFPARDNSHASTQCSLPQWDEVDVLGLLDEKSAPLLLVLEGIQDPHNLGACLRSADAAGVDAVIVPRKGTAPVTETVRRIACGGADRLPVVTVGNLVQTLERLVKGGYRAIGLTDQGSNLIYDLDLTGPLALVLGNEGTGLRRLTCDRCSAVGRIPMAGSVDCLNLSVATGITLFEAVRQRLTV